jgi:mRNA interferase HigB
MRIISRMRLREYAQKHGDAAEWLAKWEHAVSEATWRNIQDVRRVFPHADGVTVESERVVTIFNVCGNKYRLITAIHYNTQMVYVLRFLTHAEYSKGHWQSTL